MLGWLFFALLTLVGLFFLFSAEGMAILGNPDSTFYLAMAGAAIGAYALWILGGYRDRLGQALLYVLIWAGIGLVFIAGYSYRGELTAVANRVAGELMPPGEIVSSAPGENGDMSVQIRGRGDGHFLARARINGASAMLLVDTGASAVVLNPSDARRAGIDVDNLSFSVAVSTANGMAYAAPVRLKSIRVGPIEVRDVEALVARPGSLEQSLLGMSFLSRLKSYEFSRDFLTLRS